HRTSVGVIGRHNSQPDGVSNRRRLPTQWVRRFSRLIGDASATTERETKRKTNRLTRLSDGLDAVVPFVGVRRQQVQPVATPKQRAPALAGLLKLLRGPCGAQAASSSTPSSGVASSDGFGPRRGPLARAASISLTASVSVTRCTAAISRDSRSSAA